MKHLKERISNTTLKATLALLSLCPSFVLAGLPTADTVADGASTDSPIQTSRDLMTIGVTILATLFAAALVIGAGWQIYSAYVEARKKGEWQGMATVSIVGVVMIAGGVILAVLAVDYGTF